MIFPVSWRRRMAGLIWLSVWMMVLYLVVAPWWDLGGLVDERLRWLEWFVLSSGLSTGLFIGRSGRRLAVTRTGHVHLMFLRAFLYPMAILTAILLICLAATGHRGPVGIALTAFLAYWAGMDLSYCAVPLLDGRQYSLTSAITDEEQPGPEEEAQWVPPWERY